MAAVRFPTLTPSARSYKPGTFPTEQFQGQNGSVTAVKFGNRRADSELAMTFQNITDAQGSEILANYDSVMNGLDSDGDWNYIEFQDADAGALAGIKNEAMRKATGEVAVVRRYRYAEAPQFVSTFPGRCTVTVKLRGYLDGALL